MSISKLTNLVKFSDELNKINEIIDALNEGVTITVDSELSTTSENPVQNKVITTVLNGKQEALTAGDNITISNGTISADNTEYTAGSGITISNENVISSDNYSYSATCPALTSTAGRCTWQVTHNLGTQNIVVSLYAGSSELEKDVTIVSDNVINVSFFSSSDISAGARKIVVVANGASSGSTPVPVVDPNFIPKDTVIHVELDGTGDFDNLPDAVDYLTGKWSNGTVIIELGEGTFNIENKLDIAPTNGIVSLKLQGQGQTSIINVTASLDTFLDISSHGVWCHLDSFKINKSNDTRNGIGVIVNVETMASFNNIIINNFSIGIDVLHSKAHINTQGITISNCNIGVRSERLGTVATNVGSIITFDNVATAWSVITGGMIATSTPVSNITYTRVTAKCSQTVGTFNANGFIGGTLHN